MSQDAVQYFRDGLAVLRRRRSELVAELAVIDSQIDSAQAVIRAMSADDRSFDSSIRAQPQEAEHPWSRLRTPSVREVIRELADGGKQFTLAEIRSKLDEYGKDATSGTISSVISREPDIERVAGRRGVYVLKRSDASSELEASASNTLLAAATASPDIEEVTDDADHNHSHRHSPIRDD